MQQFGTEVRNAAISVNRMSGRGGGRRKEKENRTARRLLEGERGMFARERLACICKRREVVEFSRYVGTEYKQIRGIGSKSR